MSEFQYPYTCSLTPLCRAVIRVMGSYDTIKTIVEGIVEEIVEKSEIANSLKVPLGGGFKTMRQVDISTEANSPVVFKCFIGWNAELNAWHVFVEGAQENYWEEWNKVPPAGVN